MEGRPFDPRFIHDAPKFAFSDAGPIAKDMKPNSGTIDTLTIRWREKFSRGDESWDVDVEVSRIDGSMSKTYPSGVGPDNNDTLTFACETVPDRRF